MNQMRLPHRTPMAPVTWVLVIFILFVEMLAYTWIRTESTQTILRISRAQDQLAGMRSYHQELILERDRLKSDARIIHIAGSRLGLTSDVFNQTIYVDREKL